jgi:hypothetical protein
MQMAKWAQPMLSQTKLYVLEELSNIMIIKKTVIISTESSFETAQNMHLKK